MRKRSGRGPAVLVLVAACVVGSWGLWAAPAFAQGPRITGHVSGATAPQSRLILEADALQVGGWQGLDEIQIELLVDARVRDRLSFDIGDNILTVNTQDLVVGTGAMASGTYLRTSGGDVVVTTGGGHLMLRLNAIVVRQIPSSARFRMIAIDDFGAKASIVRRVAEPPSGDGFSWGQVLTFVAMALFVGGFLGNVFASKRRQPARASLYATVQRRIEEERVREREGAP